jgi:hypothetical protein
LRIQYFFVPKAGVAFEPTLVMSRTDGLGCTILGVLAVWARVVGRLGSASGALHPRFTLRKTVLVGLGAAA